MSLVKTLANGNKVYSTTEMVPSPHAWDNGQKRATIIYVEQDNNGLEVDRYQPGFNRMAGHSPASIKFGY